LRYRSAIARRGPAPGWHLTIHSSRSRFAARLNSGVRPLIQPSLRLRPFSSACRPFCSALGAQSSALRAFCSASRAFGSAPRARCSVFGRFSPGSGLGARHSTHFARRLGPRARLSEHFARCSGLGARPATVFCCWQVAGYRHAA
jgi:hypothetical protein